MLKVYDQQIKNMPLFLLIMISFFNPWQTLIALIRKDFLLNPINITIYDNSIITYLIIFIMVITTIIIITKPKIIAYLVRSSSIIILLLSIITLLSLDPSLLNFISLGLIIAYSILTISFILMITYTFHYKNMWAIFIITSLSYSLINILINNNIIPYSFYKLMHIALLFIFIIGINKLRHDVNINFVKRKKIITPPAILIGSFMIIGLATHLTCLAMIISNQIEHGMTFLFLAIIIATILLIINKKILKIDHFYIVNSFLSLAVVGLAIALLPNLTLLTCFLLGFAIVISNFTCVLLNTLFSAFTYKYITFTAISIGIITTKVTVLLFDNLKNNINTFIIICFIITLLLFIIMFIFMPLISNSYTSNIINKSKKVLFSTLTKRENEIVNYILIGYTSGQLSKKLYVSVPTIKTHVSNIYRKLKINSKQDLFELAKEQK